MELVQACVLSEVEILRATWIPSPCELCRWGAIHGTPCVRYPCTSTCLSRLPHPPMVVASGLRWALQQAR